MYLGQILAKKNDIKPLFEQPKSNNDKEQKCRNHLEHRKKWLDIQNLKTQLFFKILTWNFIHLLIEKFFCM